MGPGFSFTLLIFTLLTYYNELSSAAVLSSTHSTSTDIASSRSIVRIARRYLRETAAMEGQELEKNLGFDQTIKNVKKPSLPQKVYENVLEYLGRMNGKSKRDKFFVIATLLLLPFGIFYVCNR